MIVCKIASMQEIGGVFDVQSMAVIWQQ